MKKLALGLAIAVSGCMPIYSGPTLRPGSNVALKPSSSPVDAVVRALLCSQGVVRDTARAGSTACVNATSKDPVPGLAPAPLPVRKP